MTKPIIKIHNLETDEVIEREMTDSEFDEAQKITEENAKKIQNKTVARQEILERFGLTEEEAKLLLG